MLAGYVAIAEAIARIGPLAPLRSGPTPTGDQPRRGGVFGPPGLAAPGLAAELDPLLGPRPSGLVDLWRRGFGGRLGPGSSTGRRGAMRRAAPERKAARSPFGILVGRDNPGELFPQHRRGPTSSTAPGSRVPRAKGPYATRISRFTVKPSDSSTRRTSRFLPSVQAKGSARCWRPGGPSLGPDPATPRSARSGHLRR